LQAKDILEIDYRLSAVEESRQICDQPKVEEASDEAVVCAED
jgi:hypothetical protein